MENEIINQTPSFVDYLPYVVTVLCSIISGIASYIAARIKSKSDIQKLVKQHELDLEKERERLLKEKERILSEIARVDGKLSNQGFVSKAPATVVEGEKAKMEKYRENLAGVMAALAKLG